jgi:hypothetical protein
MTKQSPKPGDMNQRMWAVAQQAAGLDDSPVKDQKAVERGRLGGIARAKALSAEKRVAIAKGARATRGLKAAPVRKVAPVRKAARKRA